MTTTTNNDILDRWAGAPCRNLLGCDGAVVDGKCLRCGSVPPSETPPGAEVLKILRAGYEAHISGGEPWSYHDCDGPMIDGTNPCDECQQITVVLIRTAWWLELEEDVRELRAMLGRWTGSDAANPADCCSDGKIGHTCTANPGDCCPGCR